MEHCPHLLWHRAAIFSALSAAEVFRIVTFRMSTWEFSNSFPTPGTLLHVSVTFRLYALGAIWHVPHQEMRVFLGVGLQMESDTSSPASRLPLQYIYGHFCAVFF